MDPRKARTSSWAPLVSANPSAECSKKGLLGQRLADRTGRHAHSSAEGRHKMRGRRKSRFVRHLRYGHMRPPQQ
jgi:hypothetical protein